MSHTTPDPRSLPPRTCGELAAAPCWAVAQDFVVREIRAEMGRRRMTAKAMCQIAGISASHWSEMQSLKKPISLDRLIAAAMAVGLRLQVSMSPNSSDTSPCSDKVKP